MNKILFYIFLGIWIIYSSVWILKAIHERNDDLDGRKAKEELENDKFEMGEPNYHKLANGVLVLFCIFDNSFFLLCLTQVRIFENSVYISHILLTVLLLNLLSDIYASISLKLKLVKGEFASNKFRAIIFKMGLKALAVVMAVYAFIVAL